MSNQNEYAFVKACERYQALRKEHPYTRDTWRVSSEPANQCSAILDEMGNAIQQLLGELDVRCKVQSCEGIGYYPRKPWIALLFEGERPANGVYPIFDFAEDGSGFVIGCVESLTHPQGNFARDYGCAPNGENELDNHVDEHFARGAEWFRIGDAEIDFWRRLKDAVLAAIEVRNSFRANTVLSDQWYSKVYVDDVDQWVAEQTRGTGRHIFRGQGLAFWNLESGLGRVVAYERVKSGGFDVEAALNFEKESMQSFSREVAKFSEYRGFEGVDLLALMQHYGSKTRLLDFSRSPLVALYMALEQHENYMSQVRAFLARCKIESDIPEDFAVWEVNAAALRRDNLQLIEDGEIRKMKDEFQECPTWLWNRRFNHDASELLRCSSTAKVTEGVDIVVPKSNNSRISAQEGLFLMPRKLSVPFEMNLRQAFGPLDAKQHVRKYVFGASLKQQVRELLKAFCISPKLVYPDLTGLAKSENDKIVFNN